MTRFCTRWTYPLLLLCVGGCESTSENDGAVESTSASADEAASSTSVEQEAEPSAAAPQPAEEAVEQEAVPPPSLDEAATEIVERPVPPFTIARPETPAREFNGRDLSGASSEELALVADRFYQDGAFAEAYHFGLMARPSGSPYDLACYAALIGEIDAAFYYLQVAPTEQSVNPHWAAADLDLRVVREDPRWDATHRYLVDYEAYWRRSGIEEEAVYVPKGHSGEPLRFVVGMHGTGGSPGLLEVEGPRLADEYGVALLEVSGDFVAGPGRFSWTSDLEAVHERVQSGIENVSDRVPRLPDCVALYGFSLGGVMAFDLAMTYPEFYCHGFIISPMGGGLVRPDEAVPAELIERQHFYFTAGADDGPANDMVARTNRIATESGAHSTVFIDDVNRGHAFPHNYAELLAQWLEVISD